MPKLFYEDYCNGQGKVEIPNANHVGIELDDGTIIEISCNRHSHADDVDRARVSSHDALNFEPRLIDEW